MGNSSVFQPGVLLIGVVIVGHAYHKLFASVREIQGNESLKCVGRMLRQLTCVVYSFCRPLNVCFQV